MSEANKAVIMRIFEEMLNQGNRHVRDELISPDLVSDWDAASPSVDDLRASCPDLRWVVHDQIAEGDMVANRFTITGTHTGAEFMGIPPSGKRIEVKAIGVDRLADGVLLQGWTVLDTHDLLQQLRAGAN